MLNGDVALTIVKNWLWAACGALLVALRDDGTYWIYDGQHRHAAALKHDDIDDLPCLVFRMDNAQIEARIFDYVNKNRRTVGPIERYKAALFFDDAVASIVDRMVTSAGYKVATGYGAGTVGCIKALQQAVKQNSAVSQNAFKLCAEISDGKAIPDELFNGIYRCEVYLKAIGSGSVLDANNKRRLLEAGVVRIREEITAVAKFNKSSKSQSVCAEGVIRVLNEKRKTRIPSLIA